MSSLSRNHPENQHCSASSSPMSDISSSSSPLQTDLVFSFDKQVSGEVEVTRGKAADVDYKIKRLKLNWFKLFRQKEWFNFCYNENDPLLWVNFCLTGHFPDNLVIDQSQFSLRQYNQSCIFIFIFFSFVQTEYTEKKDDHGNGKNEKIVFFFLLRAWLMSQ